MLIIKQLFLFLLLASFFSCSDPGAKGKNVLTAAIVEDPGVQVTGIATTFTATMEVLKKAVDNNINFIVTHEPTFYNHLDETSQFEGDKIMEAKRKYILENGIVVWRFHDHIHRMAPDGIEEGMARGLGWEKYLVPGDGNVFNLPVTTLKKLAEEDGMKYLVDDLREVFGGIPVQFIPAGNPFWTVP